MVGGMGQSRDQSGSHEVLAMLPTISLGGLDKARPTLGLSCPICNKKALCRAILQF